MKNTEFGMVDDPYGPLDNSALGLPLATCKEAPAETGEHDGAWIIYFEDRDRELEAFSGFGAREAAQRRYEQVTVSWNAHLFERVKSALPALRAQPQAREDTQPVGWLRAVDEEMVCAHLGVADAEDSFETAKKKLASLIQWNIAVATDLSVGGHPAPDALRVAVEALEPFAYFAKHGISREYINSDAPDDGLCAAASFPAGAYRGAVQALAAMQAKK